MRAYLVIFLLCASLRSLSGRRSWSMYKDGPIDVDQLLDKFLVWVNDDLRAWGRATVELRDFSIGGAVGKGVSLSGVDRLTRSGPASLSSKGTVMETFAVVSLTDPVLSVRQFTFENHTAPVDFLIKNNSLALSYSINLREKARCYLKWGEFKLITLDEVTAYSPDPWFNEAEVSEEFSDTIKDELNILFSTKGFHSFLQESVNPCRVADVDPGVQLTLLLAPPRL